MTIPSRIFSPLNGSQGSWRAQSAKRKQQRRLVQAVLAANKPLPSTPCVVTLTRVAPRPLDDDNLAAGFKSVRDEVAAALGCGDSVRDPVQWKYAQAVGKAREYLIGISIEPWRVET